MSFLPLGARKQIRDYSEWIDWWLVRLNRVFISVSFWYGEVQFNSFELMIPCSDHWSKKKERKKKKKEAIGDYDAFRKILLNALFSKSLFKLLYALFTKDLFNLLYALFSKGLFNLLYALFSKGLFKWLYVLVRKDLLKLLYALFRKGLEKAYLSYYMRCSGKA